MFSGKVAFVTGGGSGLGRATCQVLAREGAQVVVVDINAETAKETISLLQGSSHSYHVLDVTDRGKVESAVKDIIVHHKAPPTIVVNCAGICIENEPSAIQSEDFDMLHGVNAKGTLNVIQATCKEMIQRKLSGSIINIGSIAYKYSLSPKYTAYSMTKAGVQALTKSVSHEMGVHGIRCNVIHPGLIVTPMSVNHSTEDFQKGLVSITALKRAGQPHEVAEVVAFLASDKSSYVTGASIEVSGGYC